MATRRAFLQTAAASGVLASGIPTIAYGCNTVDKLTVNHGAATVHPLATRSAMRILQRGGNAIDAAISAALVLGVVDGHNSGIGGGCLVLIRTAKDEILAIDGRETAGQAAHEQMFIRDGKADPKLSQDGPLASGVPSQIAAMKQMHSLAGRMPWKDLFADAHQAALDGVAASKSIGRTIAAEADELRKYPASQAIYFHPDDSPIREGELLVQKDLANTLAQIAEQGAEWFYQGPFAQACANYLKSIGGILTAEDFRTYQPKLRTPITTKYRGYDVIGFPPPSSGGIHIAQMLRMLEPYPVGAWMHSRPEAYYHLLCEVMKRAFADRAHWLGDSDFVDVPAGLLDPQYSQDRMADFSDTVASADIQHGWPNGTTKREAFSSEPGPGEDRKHTTHLTTADDEGNWVAMTCTVNTSWGSKVTVPSTGVMLNNQMDDFSISPGTPNAFGLIGSQSNAVAPAKRPLSSMSPTMVLDQNRQPILTAGAAGGPRIINATLQVLLRVLDGGCSIAEAVAAPRVHHQWRPDQFLFEEQIGVGSAWEITPAIRERLSKMGHPLKASDALAISQAIHRQGNRLEAAHDPRSHGSSEA
jgi:gamma-glutamyltranspeptidase/glutathione hydrolase